VVAARTLVDPHDPDDLVAVAAVQDQLGITAGSTRPFELPEYETSSLDRTRNALLVLAAEQGSFERTSQRQCPSNFRQVRSPPRQPRHLNSCPPQPRSFHPPLCYYCLRGSLP
jgi:hypothetical protein